MALGEKDIKKTAYLWVLLSMCLLYPLLLLAGECFDFFVRVRSWGVHGVLFTLLFSLVSLRVLRMEGKSRAESILSCLLLPASALHAAVWTVGFARFWLAAFLSLVWVGFSTVIMAKNVGALGAKVAAVLPSVLIMLPTLLVMLFLLIPLGHRTVVQTVTSPEGNYRAEVIDVNEGALGGATLVEVYDLGKQVDGIVFHFQKEPQTVYDGDWGKFKTMRIKWESEQVLLINGHPNPIQ